MGVGGFQLCFQIVVVLSKLTAKAGVYTKHKLVNDITRLTNARTRLLPCRFIILYLIPKITEEKTFSAIPGRGKSIVSLLGLPFFSTEDYGVRPINQ